ncbi:MAG: hypothetical protein PSX37_05200, partial [bacterium]|nr:hypothetical protein [bacterium]
MPTSTEPGPTDVTLWLLPEQVEFARRILDRAGARCVRAGCPRKGQSVSGVLGAASFDDLRAELASPMSSLFILLASDGFDGGSAAEDLRNLGISTAGQRTRILTLDPIPTSAAELIRSSKGVPAEAMPQLLGLPRRSPALIAGNEWL